MRRDASDRVAQLDVCDHAVEFDVRSHLFALRFLRATDAQALMRVLGIVYRTIASHLLRKARLTRAAGVTGAVTLIQRFGSALNLNIHFHMLFLDGAYFADTHPPVAAERLSLTPQGQVLFPAVSAGTYYLYGRFYRTKNPRGGGMVWNFKLQLDPGDNTLPLAVDQAALKWRRVTRRRPFPSPS